MRAGTLRHVIKIQTPVLAEDSYSAGSVITSWNDKYRSVRAAIHPMSSREHTEDMKLAGETTHRIRIRFREGITPKLRIIHRRKGVDRVFNIKSVINIRELNRELDILCTEEISE
jgi:SPP1 family predicted phage head-tail adaptor